MTTKTYAKAARRWSGALIGLAGAWFEARAQQTPGSATPPGTAVGEVVELPAAIDAITARGVVRIGVPDDLPPFGAPAPMASSRATTSTSPTSWPRISASGRSWSR